MRKDNLSPQKSIHQSLKHSTSIQEGRDNSIAAGVQSTTRFTSGAPVTFNEVLALAREIRLMLDPTYNSIVHDDITQHTLATWIHEAQTLLGEDVVYNDDLIKSLKKEGKINDITAEHYQHNDEKLCVQSLHAILAEKVTPLRLKGQTAKQLRHTLKDIDNKSSCFI